MKAIFKKWPLTVVGLLIGVFLGILYSFGGLILDALVSLELITSDETPGLSYGTVLAFGALIGMPIIFGLIGCIIDIIILGVKFLISLLSQ